MSVRGMAVLLAGLLLAATCANAASKSAERIKVLDSETRSVSLGDNGTPTNCDQVTFDAYCRSSRTAIQTNTLLVQEGDAPPFRISCTVESKYSRCRPLPIGETFDARREKNGITVYYEDDKGKPRKQLYTLVASSGVKADSPTLAAPVAAQSATAAPVSTPAPATSAAAAAEEHPIRCDFSSTPSGAEITIDGKYVGSTPSEIAIATGTHIVEFSMPGFAQWKRDLTITPGSGVINVAASLQKAP